jgi:N-acetylmuramoyl-L-alanine amidase
MRNIDYIVIHCTATPQHATVESILNYWRNNLGWKNPGYHMLIEANGKVHKLQDFDNPTNGVKGHNYNSIHISYIGGVTGTMKPIDNRTYEQKAAILDCIRQAVEYTEGKKLIIQGHRDFPGVTKACPSFDAKKEYKWIMS